jgi:hypothetical protein
VTAVSELPAIGALSQRQQRGVDCVFCGIVLTPATAVDLGPRRIRVADWDTQWFPRCCRTCPKGDQS